MKKQQTAVEYLAERMIRMIPTNSIVYEADVLMYIEQAKQMEKEQHDKTAEDWWKEGAHYVETQGMAEWENFDEYWKERFKTK